MTSTLVFDDGSPEEAKKKKPFFRIAKPTALLLFSNVNKKNKT
jgi:hypothetical protein